MIVPGGTLPPDTTGGGSLGKSVAVDGAVNILLNVETGGGIDLGDGAVGTGLGKF